MCLECPDGDRRLCNTLSLLFRPAYLFVSNHQGQSTSLCVCEHQLQALVEFGTLEKTFKITQRLQVALLNITNIMWAVGSDSTAVLILCTLN